MNRYRELCLGRAGAAVLALVPLSSCPEKNEEMACGVNLHTDDALCENGHDDPGELCLRPDGSLPLAKTMYALHNLTLADFNGDGHLDLRIGGEIYAGNGDGSFSEVFIRPGGSSQAKDVASGDFNGDGIADLAYVSYNINPLDEPGEEDLKLLVLWSGNAALDPLQTVSVTDLFVDYPANVVAADFNEDGIDDLAVAQRSWDIEHCDAEILFNVGPELVKGARIPGLSGASGCRLATFDIDGDGHADVDTTLEAFHAGAGTGEFIAVKSQRPLAGTAAYGHDLNCDEVPDAVGRQNGTTQVWQGVGKGEFDVAQAELSAGDVFVAVAALNRDVEPDILVAGSLGLRVLLGDADLGFPEAVVVSTEAGYTELAVADINEDGRPDVAALGPSRVDIFLSHP
jgi:hypothetical protein